MSAIAGAAALIVGVAIIAASDDGAGQSSGTTLDPNESGQTGGSVELGVESSVGVIRWERIDGSRSSLPGRVVASTDSMLLGLGEQGVAAWQSIDGRQWSPNQDLGVADVGGARWVVRRADDRRRLMQVSEAGERPVTVLTRGDGPATGFTTTFEVPEETGDGLPIEIGGTTYVRLDRRVEVPWREVLDLPDHAGFRVDVNVGAETFTISSTGGRPDMTNHVLTAVPGRGTDRFDLVGDDGTVVWTFDAGGVEPQDALQTSVSPSWVRWDGLRLVEVAAPWAASGRVEVFAVDAGMLAFLTVGDADSGAAAWRTADGQHWQAVELPAERSVGSPISVHADGGAVLLTISSRNLTTNWETRDGVVFEELPAVPGIAQRSQGTFGWVAPDPRSSPRISVSPDGHHWDQIDIGDELDVESSRWDLTIHATAIASEIYVIATRGESRTLLIGTVTPSP